jgi:uncharacterized protein (TIGR03083 family)
MTHTEIGDAEFLVTIIDDAHAISAVLRRDGGSADIAHCPGWQVRDVVAHLGDVHRWATEIVRTGRPAADGHPAPGSDSELAEWFDVGASELVAVLARTDPLTPCWTLGASPGLAGFWRRRQALETAVHRFDVEHAGGASRPIPVDLAAAGVTEVVEVLYPRQVRLGRTPSPGFEITLRATDHPGGARWRSTTWQLGTTGPHAELSGATADLLLMLWGRPHAGLDRAGDPSALAALDAAAITP